MDSVMMYLYLRKNVLHFSFLRLFCGELCNFLVMLSNFLHCLIEITMFLCFVNMIFLKLLLIFLCLHFGKEATALVVVAYSQWLPKNSDKCPSSLLCHHFSNINFVEVFENNTFHVEPLILSRLATKLGFFPLLLGLK